MGSYEAVKVRLDPTPRQGRLMASHAGAARFAYNAGLAHVKEALDNGESPDWSHYALLRWWNANKDTLAVNPHTGAVVGCVACHRVSRTGLSPVKVSVRAVVLGSLVSSRKTPLRSSLIPQGSPRPRLVTLTG